MILVTGATGLLGAHVVRLGLEAGRKIRIVARGVSPRSYVHGVQDQIEVVQTDLLAPLPDLFAGVDAVIHCAAMASPHDRDLDAMMQTNVTLTERLFRAAAAAGVPRWLQVSSVATKSGGKQPIDETSSTPRDTAYARSKLLADQFLAAQSSGPRVTTVFPTFMLGSWDARPSSGGVFLALRYGFLKHYVNCAKNMAAAGDVAQGVWLALDKGGGSKFLLGGKDVELRDFFAETLQAMGLPPIVEVTELPVDEPIVRELCTPSQVRSEKAVRELGYAPTADPFIALHEHLAYLSKVNLLRKKK
jgi:dihydroflavonol-4-reductase